MLRGGSWNNNQENARAEYRNNNHPQNRNNNIGFRVVSLSTSTFALHDAGMSRQLRLEGCGGESLDGAGTSSLHVGFWRQAYTKARRRLGKRPTAS